LSDSLSYDKNICKDFIIDKEIKNQSIENSNEKFIQCSSMKFNKNQLFNQLSNDHLIFDDLHANMLNLIQNSISSNLTFLNNHGQNIKNYHVNTNTLPNDSKNFYLSLFNNNINEFFKEMISFKYDYLKCLEMNDFFFKKYFKKNDINENFNNQENNNKLSNISVKLFKEINNVYINDHLNKNLIEKKEMDCMICSKF